MELANSKAERAPDCVKFNLVFSKFTKTQFVDVEDLNVHL